MGESVSIEKNECGALAIAFQREVVKLASFLEGKSFDKKDQIKRYALLYAAQALDFSKALLILQKNDVVASQFPIWRSLFEVYVRFCYLIGDETNRDEGQQKCRLNDLLLEAYEDEKKFLDDKDKECSLPEECLSVELTRVNEIIKNLKSRGAVGKSLLQYMKELSNTSGVDNPTSGWYPKFRIFSGFSHGRLTLIEKIYEINNGEFNFPAKQSDATRAFILSNAQQFLVAIGAGVTSLWGDGDVLVRETSNDV
jgi:hypothetical protein